jgi:microcystin-dependent protein
MASPFLGEIRMFAGNFAPVGWQFCNGALLSTGEYEALYSLLGTTYGGDGQNTFALPNLQSRLPIHAGNYQGSYVLGQMAGTESVTLTPQQMPNHTHTVSAQSQLGDKASPANAYVASSSLNQFSASNPTVSMSGSAVSFRGGNQPHDNVMPFLAINFIICTEGIYPSQP